LRLTMIFYGIIKRGRIMLSISQKLLKEHYLTNMTDDTPIICEIKPVRQGKTHQQVKTIFGLALITIKAEFDDRGYDTSMLLNLPETTGNEVSINLLKEFFYAVCPIYNEDGQRITLSHKDCDTKLAAKFFEEIRNWSASQWSIYIQDPNPEWRSNTAQDSD
jgi:hypothetical protein